MNYANMYIQIYKNAHVHTFCCVFVIVHWNREMISSQKATNCLTVFFPLLWREENSNLRCCLRKPHFINKRSSHCGSSKYLYSIIAEFILSTRYDVLPMFGTRVAAYTVGILGLFHITSSHLNHWYKMVCMTDLSWVHKHFHRKFIIVLT